MNTSRLPATPLEHLQCVRRIIRSANSGVRDEDVRIELDKEGREKYDKGEAVSAVVKVTGIAPEELRYVQKTSFRAAIDDSEHVIHFLTSQAVPSLVAAKLATKQLRKV
eukprot:TRINITY_DN4342_c0_g1_i1.p1 TRINITY_DN4342_c0_g1~~TRINITY_DN4342_c0_g1_i1.p1  ORF type:complete len:109 (+),score=19.21 TRINITY_DN4342_c0_g1_i1:266-592(+)